MGGQVHGNRACFPTPGHSKADRGSWATIVPGAPDGVLIHSNNGGDPLAIKDMLRDKGVLPKFEPQNQSTGPAITTGTYQYDDGNGNVTYRTRRIEQPGKGKRFMAERLEGGRWVAGLADLPRFPYRFTDICNAAHEAREACEPAPLIYFVEGERKADKLAEMGFLATAIAFGCNGWRDEYGEAFRDTNIIMLPDNDAPGQEFAQTVKAGVEANGGTVAIVDLPSLPPKGDIMDWTGTPDDLRALTDKALASDALPMPTLDLAMLAETRATAKRFVIEGFAPAGEVTLLTGAGSAGKSLLAQQFAVAAAAGKQCLGLAVDAGPSLYFTAEDDERELHWRLQHLCEAMDVGIARLVGKLHLSSGRGVLDNALEVVTDKGVSAPSASYLRLSSMIKRTGAKLAFLDNVAHLFTGNENDRGDVTQFVNLLNRLAGETGAAIILLAHPPKASRPGEKGHDFSGSTAWLNAVRSQINIDHDAETDFRTLSVGKANFAKKGTEIRFRWHDFAFWLDNDLPSDTRAELDQTIKQNNENDAFLRCLRARMEQPGREVGPNPGSNYAPARFAEMTEANGVSKPALARAMERLIHVGIIETREVPRKGSDTKTIIAEVIPGGS